MSKPTVVDVGNAFGRFPAGRSRSDSLFSGEAFREDVAEPALADGGEVVFDFSGVVGFPSSFLEEAFGVLIRMAIRRGDDPDALITRIKVISPTDTSLAEEVRQCMMDASRNQL
ncbi:STAS-like domain-containing protein [Sphingomonas sanguinis]|uniref:STAS-like domain-containing protein n=1 Tax=Sphingomonas sanguinis TaxID=33051 RepID=A0ABU5LM71_9SPHN|nr:STAS-like domain-containing protein [Sphingomonas sanguinis]MDZ7281037.1 STAS-like domain-containing protein [Sphingomonas sanguinis]